MTINFGVGTAVVFCLGISGDLLGLERTYILTDPEHMRIYKIFRLKGNIGRVSSYI